MLVGILHLVQERQLALKSRCFVVLVELWVLCEIKSRSRLLSLIGNTHGPIIERRPLGTIHRHIVDVVAELKLFVHTDLLFGKADVILLLRLQELYVLLQLPHFLELVVLKHCRRVCEDHIRLAKELLDLVPLMVMKLKDFNYFLFLIKNLSEESL